MAKTVKAKKAPKKPEGAKKNRTGATRGRADKRVQVLLYMHAHLVAELKEAAIEEDTTAFRLNEKAIEAFLEARRKRKKLDVPS